MSEHRFSTPQLLAGAFGLVTAAAAGTWALRYDRLEELESRVAAYEKTSEWNVPDLLHNLEVAATRLERGLESAEHVRSLEDRVTQLTVEVEGAKREAEQADGQLKQVRAALADKQAVLDQMLLTDSEFDLREHEPRLLGREALPLAVDDIMATSVEFTLDNAKRSMSVGSYVMIKEDGRDCKLLLAGIGRDYTHATFRVLCAK